MLPQLQGDIHFAFIAESGLIITAHIVASSERRHHAPWHITVAYAGVIIGSYHTAFPHILKPIGLKGCVAERIVIAHETRTEPLLKHQQTTMTGCRKIIACIILHFQAHTRGECGVILSLPQFGTKHLISPYMRELSGGTDVEIAHQPPHHIHIGMDVKFIEF